MTKKGLTIVLAVVCTLCVVGAVFAANAWLSGAQNNGNTITTGQTLQMTLTNNGNNENSPLYPGNTATIKLKADNKNYLSTLTITLQCDDLSSVDSWQSKIEIKYQIGSTGTPAEYQAGGVDVAAYEGEQEITLTFTLATDAPDTMAGKTIKVLISLNEKA